MLARWFAALLARYLTALLPKRSRVLAVHAGDNDRTGCGLALPHLDLIHVAPQDCAAALSKSPCDAVVLNGTVHYITDIQALFETLAAGCPAHARLIVISYSALWRPVLNLAARLGLRRTRSPRNWVAPEDVRNLLSLSGFELLRRDRRVLLPLPIPLLAGLVNRLIAPLPVINACCLLNVMVARPRVAAAPTMPAAPTTPPTAAPSVSVVVPARNEAGNISAVLARLPAMGPDDEIIFVEGHSSDGTWNSICAEVQRLGPTRRIIAVQQDGTGKGDAVRKGFSLATRELLMILDADLSVAPEELPRFYRVLAAGQGEFVNGSRLVYPMEAQAMQFANILANKAFALAFSFVLGQDFKDTLCGTKALSRRHYQLIAQERAYFGDFDPFGDFDLLFGAARLSLKIVEVPIHYHERVYGTTNIRRWRHGCLLAAMLMLAARRIKFI